MNHNDDNKQEIQVNMPTELQGGTYANQMLVSHTPEEFILDFVLTTAPIATVNARVVISPAHAKRMIQALQESVQHYETQFGEITLLEPIPQGVIRH